jgi:putative flavoprotein involved in K+ transport
MAVGFYQQPKVPPFSANCPGEICQIHSADYRNPQALPEGGVLVVGSAQSGSQLAEELLESGRDVYLSVSETGRFPRRYRGVDAAVWMEKMGYFKRTVDQLPSDQARFAASATARAKMVATLLTCISLPGMACGLIGRITSIADQPGAY